MTNQRMLLPELAMNMASNQASQKSIREEWEEHTFAVDPQERSSRLPFFFFFFKFNLYFLDTTQRLRLDIAKNHYIYKTSMCPEEEVLSHIRIAKAQK